MSIVDEVFRIAGGAITERRHAAYELHGRADGEVVEDGMNQGCAGVVGDERFDLRQRRRGEPIGGRDMVVRRR